MHASLKTPKPWWLTYFSLGIALYGIFVLKWPLPPIILLFWWEILLMLGSAMLRMLCAMDLKPFNQTLALKLGLLIGGGVMGIAMFMLAVSFSFKGVSGNMDPSAMHGFPLQSRLMLLAYLTSLALHFFLNGRYKAANPMGELAPTFIHILLILAPLQALGMHLIPRYPHLNQALWVTAALLVVKFVVDLLFNPYSAGNTG
jgi:Family of unknown function (DUF6498)